MISVYKDFDNPPKDLLGNNPQITDAVKRELWELYHGKCAFSEEKFSSFEKMEVAHYRPVKAYPELEFEWSNLLPVSGRVYEAFVINNFPIQGDKVNSELLKNPENRKADSECLLAEKALLVHPEVDTPENHFYFLDERISAFTLKGKTTIELLKLNNEYLLTNRKKVAPKLDELITELRNAIEEIKKQSDNTDFGDSSQILPSYLSTITHFYEKSKLFSNKIKSNSYFSHCFFEKKLIGIQYAYMSESTSATSSPIIDAIISSGLNFLVNVPFYIKKQDGTLQELESPLDTAWANGMKIGIQSISIKKFYSIKFLKIKGIPINTQWIFLTGENGYGKTLVLQAIALTFSGEGSFEADKIHYTDDRTNIVTTLVNNAATIKKLSFPRNINWNNRFEPVLDFKEGNTVVSARPEFWNYAAYGANRLELSGYLGVASQSPQKINKTDSLFTNNGTLHNIEEYLINIHGREQFQTRYNSIKTILLEILPNIADIIIDDTYEKKKVLYQEQAEDGSLLPLIPFHVLSTGIKNLIALIGDIIIELSRRNDFTHDYHPSDLEGIVIIDEIDAHLHPKWQKELVQTLTRLFPKIQFIASTHSPIPLLGAPKETVILNVEKPSKKEGITVRRLDIDVTTLTPNTILSSPIFGFEELNSVENKDKKRIYTQENYDDVLFEQKLKENLKKLVNEDDLNKYIIKGDKNG